MQSYTVVIVDKELEGTHIMLAHAPTRQRAIEIVVVLVSDGLSFEQTLTRYVVIGAKKGDHRDSLNAFFNTDEKGEEIKTH